MTKEIDAITKLNNRLTDWKTQVTLWAATLIAYLEQFQGVIAQFTETGQPLVGPATTGTLGGLAALATLKYVYDKFVKK